MYRPDVSTDEIVQLYESGLSTPMLAARFDMSISSIKKRLDKAGATLRPSGWCKYSFNRDAAVKMYEQGTSLHTIAEKFDCPESYVREIINRSATPTRSYFQSRLANGTHSRVGVVRANKNGYLLEGVAEDDPYFSMCNYAGWILQHRYVMAKHLGRILEPFENVHHKNGIRTDNAIGNLELWCSPQLYGQRVEDLISFVVTHYRSEVADKFAETLI